MRTEYVNPRYGLNPHEAYWIYSNTDLDRLLQTLEQGHLEDAQRILKERRFPLAWQSNK